MESRIPEVSVVLICWNDAARLPRALRSVQRQTLRNLEIIVVDDASSDGTEAIVRAAMEQDPRIRYERLDVNSGGCSAPRNRGTQLARAPWVMFCDSDDEYERHACKNLLQAAERLDAQVVCGTAVRVDVRTGKTRRWRSDVHAETRVGEGLSDFPELLSDTISVNKIYQRRLLQDNGITFPEGLLFEDQMFTLEAMAAAARVAAIPETVYRWYVDRLSDEPSITQRRKEARNVEDRIEINRRIDAFLEARGLDALRDVKDLKFLRHDLYLYLVSILEVDDETARILMDRLVPYVAGVNLRRCWQLRTGLRVAIYHLLVGDLEGVRSAMRLVKWASVVDMPIIADDGREYWACEHLRSGEPVGGIEAREWLDVTELRLLRVPFTQRRFLHRVEEFAVTDGRVTVSGSTVDYDGSLADADGIEVRFLSGEDRTVLAVPAQWVGSDGVRRTWRAQARPEDRLGVPLEFGHRGSVALAVTAGDLVNMTTARVSEASSAQGQVPFPGTCTWTGADTLELVALDNGGLGWVARRSSPWRTRLDATRSAWFRVPGSRIVERISVGTWRHVSPAVLRWFGSLLGRRDLAVFESDSGRTALGNARAISDLLQAQHPRVQQAWVYARDPDRVPAGAEPVRRGGLRHAWLLARARYWVDDGTSAPAAKPRGVTHVRSGSGVPVHRVGLDDPSVLVSPAAVRSLAIRARSWDLMVTSSRFDSEVTSRAFGYRGRLAEGGVARMDGALSARAADEVAGLRRRLDLPVDRPVILYAPTWRGAQHDSAEPLIDLEEWTREIADRAYLLLRPHPAERFTVPTSMRAFIRGIGGRHDVSDFLACADLFVSDYSSLIGDAALADIPIALFQPDRETYVRRTRGIYGGLDAVGPVVASTRELICVVEQWLADREGWDQSHAMGRRAYASDHCGPADGHATARILDVMRGKTPSTPVPGGRS